MLLAAVRMIIAQKCVECRRPLIATSMEVMRRTGMTRDEQLKAVRALEAEGRVVVGKTFNDIYYRLVET